MVAIVDYGVGNVQAIRNIIKKVGGQSVITHSEEEIQSAEKLILPGVGSFGYCREQLTKRNLIPLLEDQVLLKKKLILGLCVGAQLMTRQSEEGHVEGLGWVNADTVKFDEARQPVIPHMSWTDVHFTEHTTLGVGLESESRFYFVHSYHFAFHDQHQVLATAKAGYEFACAFHKENIFGVQFHPEKSHRFGMRLMTNFLQL
jgi:glutamine amidotransferase